MPEWKREARARLAGLPLAPARAEEIAEELAQHLADRYGELLDLGHTAEAARAAALEELAGDERLRDGLRGLEAPPAALPSLGAPPSVGWWSGIASDVRYGLRSLRRSPAVSVMALVALALGIGANTAIFSVVNAVLLRPLPFAEPERLVAFWGTAPEMGIRDLSYPEAFYAYFRARTRTLETIAAYATFSMTLTDAGEPERLNAAGVTVDFFQLLGRSPSSGRGFLPEEGQHKRNYVAVLSHGLWQRRFGGDPETIGRALTLNGERYTVVGIMAPGFDFPARNGPSDIWVPLGIDPQNLDCWCYSMLGRLARGRSANDATRELPRLSDAFWSEREGRPVPDPGSIAETKTVVVVTPLARNLVGALRTPVLVLLGAVAMVLLIACANVANLLLTRASARGREIAVRCCLGATPWRIARQLLVESLLLAGGGAVLGVGLAFGGVRALGHFLTERVTHVHAIGIEPRVLLFTLGVTLVTAVLFGLAPALRGASVDLNLALKEAARGSRGARSQWLNQAFVVSQLALSLMLLVGAGLLLRSFRNLLDVDLGFRPENVLVGRVSLPQTAYPEASQIRAFYGQLIERVRALPGVRSAGLSSSAPFSFGGNGYVFMVKGREPAPGEPNLVAEIRSVTPGYFEAVATRIERGRVIEESDTGAAPPVAVVDETFARRFWPDGNAIGQQLRLGNATSHEPWLTIVGVVASVKHADVTEDPVRYIYTPLAQASSRSMDIVARTAGDPTTATAAVRGELARLDPTLPLYEIHTLAGAVSRSLGTQRLTNLLLQGFALAALLLAAVGTYGVIALGVGQRAKEFGIRLALGAVPRDILTLVLRQGLRLVVIGIALGLAGAAVFTRFLGALLFRVAPFDPWTLGAVMLLLGASACAACYVPARRAARSDPLDTLRSE